MFKIGFIISGFAYSGAEIVLQRYLKNNNMIEPYFFVIYDKQDIIKTLQKEYGSNKVIPLYIKHKKNIIRYIPIIDIFLLEKKIRKYIEKYSIDVIYANNTIEALMCSSIAKNANIPSIAHIHDMKTSIKSLIRRYHTKLALKNYNQLIMVSNACFKDWNIPKAKVVYNGLEDKYFKNIIIDKYRERKIKKFLYIGTLSKRKGVDILISNIDYFIKNNYSIQFVTKDSNGNYYDKIRRLSEKYPYLFNLKVNMSEDDVINLIDTNDVLIVPSRHDPLPTVIMEAMARGMIVIGNNVDGIPEMLSNEFLVYQQGDMCCKIGEICRLQNSQLLEISKKLYSIATIKYRSSNKMAKVNSIIKNCTLERRL